MANFALILKMMANERREIKTLEDIKLLVDSFYSRVRENEKLGPVFAAVVKDNWPVHLDKMYRFWQTVLLEEHTYFGGPFPPHAKLPIGKEHFDEWLTLWNANLDEHFIGEKAEEAKWRADKMGAMFVHKLEYYKGKTPLI